MTRMRIQMALQQQPLEDLFPRVAKALRDGLNRAAVRYSARRRKEVPAGPEDLLIFMVRETYGVPTQDTPKRDLAAMEMGLLIAIKYARLARDKRMRNWSWSQFRSFAHRGGE